jgi:hypothetical protein
VKNLLAILAFALVSARIAIACGPAQLTPAEGARLLDHAATLQHCEDVGRDAGTMAAYDACLSDAGVRR